MEPVSPSETEACIATFAHKFEFAYRTSCIRNETRLTSKVSRELWYKIWSAHKQSPWIRLLEPPDAVWPICPRVGCDARSEMQPAQHSLARQSELLLERLHPEPTKLVARG